MLLLKFERTAKLLSLTVLSLVGIGLPLLPHIVPVPTALSEPLSIRFAFAAAALAVLWHGSARSQEDMVSLVCSLLVPFLACFAGWQDPKTQLALAVCLCLLGFGLLLLRLHWLDWPAQMLFLSVAGVGILNLVMRFYNASPSGGVAPYVGTTFLPAVSLSLLAAAALCLRPSSGFMLTLSSANVGGTVSRKLLPAALLVPVFIGWLRLQGQLLGLYDTLWGLTLFVVASILAFGFILWYGAAVLNRLDTARSEAERELSERDRRLALLFEKTGIGDYTWNIAEDTVRVHPVIGEMYGEEHLDESIPGDWFRARQHPDDAVMIEEGLKYAMDNRKPVDIEFRVVLPDGGIRWISCRANVVYDQAGVPTHINGLNIDVTARKRAEAAMRKSVEMARDADQQMHTALEFAKVPVWRWLAATNSIRWSGPVEAVFGKSPHELATHEQFLECVHPDDRVAFEAKLAESQSSGVEYESQFRFLTPAGTRWIDGRGHVLRDVRGQVYGMSGVNFDITANKLAEQRLMESECRFRELADAMPQMVWICDIRGRATYFNRQWYDYTGSDTVQERYQCIHPDDLLNIRNAWGRAIESETPVEYELRIKRASDNTYRWHLARALPIRDQKGEIFQWYGTSTDIEDFKIIQSQIEFLNSDLKRQVSEVAESELRYRLLVEGVKDYAILLLDSEGRVKSWNKGAELLTGYKVSEILGKPMSVFYNQASIEIGAPAESLREAVEQDRYSHEGWTRRQDGSEFWSTTLTTPLWDSNHQLRGFSKVIRDMTEQRRVEALLIDERKRAEAANEAKSAFLASMSHEIRTPMNAILGMADMLWESELSPTQRHYVEIFRRAGGNLLTLINDILDLAKIESGTFSLDERDFNVTTMIEQVIEILTPKAESKSISLHAQLAFGSVPNLVGDPVRLQQILINLIGNAIKFTESGEVLLRARCVDSRTYARLEFDICDNGIGIPADKLESIFGDFEQAETSTTRRFGGTGLGLGISRRLIMQMRGEIHVQSELGKGSTFSFHVILPVSVGPAPPNPVQLQDIRGKRVLIVDNNSTNRVILSEMCSAWGLQVADCAASTEAIDLTKAGQSFDLVLLERLMPGLDGFETARQMQLVSPLMAIFILSSDTKPGDLARCRELGLAGHLMKPIRRAELLEQIVKALASKTDLSAAVSRLQLKNSIKAGKRFRILAAEDSEDNRFLLKFYCEGSAYDLTFAEDGAKAVAAYAKEPFDLVAMDIQMPVMDGLTAATEIRKLESSRGAKRVPILALTANALPRDIQRSRDAGCDAHISKPVSKQNFLNGLEQWLAKYSDNPGRTIEIPHGLEQLAPKYLAARRKELSVFNDLLVKADFENLRRLGHNLKGTGTSYGFPDFTRLGHAIEQAAKDCDAAELSLQILALSESIDTAEQQLHALIPQ